MNLDHENINGLNLYCYCENDPVNKYDPTGHFAISALIIGLVLGAGIGFGTAVATDYSKDKDIFDGSVSVDEYIGTTLLGAIVGALGAMIISKGVFIYELYFTLYDRDFKNFNSKQELVSSVKSRYHCWFFRVCYFILLFIFVSLDLYKIF